MFKTAGPDDDTAAAVAERMLAQARKPRMVMMEGCELCAGAGLTKGGIRKLTRQAKERSTKRQTFRTKTHYMSMQNLSRAMEAGSIIIK